MKYADGTEVKLGDRVKLGEDESGIVVCSIDTSQYADGFPERQWAYLEKGVLIKFSTWGLIHYTTPEADLQCIERGHE